MWLNKQRLGVQVVRVEQARQGEGVDHAAGPSPVLRPRPAAPTIACPAGCRGRAAPCPRGPGRLFRPVCCRPGRQT